MSQDYYGHENQSCPSHLKGEGAEYLLCREIVRHPRHRPALVKEQRLELRGGRVRESEAGGRGRQERSENLKHAPMTILPLKALAKIWKAGKHRCAKIRRRIRNL